MFDFSLTGILVAFVAGLWASLSTQTAVAFLGALAAGALAYLTRRSALLRAVWVGLAVALIVFAVLDQSATSRGALKAQARTHALALQAERERAERAEAITAELAEQATRDLADAQADATNLKDLTHALAQDPRRDSVCLDRSIARRLRKL